ncbi:hypothetical protein ACFLT2_02075 [Acidobacteriota bacterium]
MKLKKIVVLMVSVALFATLPFCSNVQKGNEQKDECLWQQVGTIEYEQCRLRHLNERLKEFHDLIKGFIKATVNQDYLRSELEKLKQPTALRLSEHRGINDFIQGLQQFKNSHTGEKCGKFEFRVLSYFIRNIPFSNPQDGLAIDAEAIIEFEIKCITNGGNATTSGGVSLFHILRCRWD